MKITRAGVDIAKSVFHVHAVDRHSHCQWQVKLKRSEWLDAMSEHLAPGADDRIAVPSRSACAGRSRSFGMRSSAASEKRTPVGVLAFIWYVTDSPSARPYFLADASNQLS